MYVTDSVDPRMLLQQIRILNILAYVMRTLSDQFVCSYVLDERIIKGASKN